MSDLKMQEEFTIRTGLLWKPADDYIQQMWKSCWQASRECLVIDLPPEPEYPDEPDDAIDDSYMDEYHSSVGMRHACINFIHAAGVKTK